MSQQATDLAPARSPGGPIHGEDAIATLSPLGLGHDTHHGLAAAARTAWRHRSQARLAWRLLSQGVCDACDLGPRGLKDDAGPGLHLCSKRLDGLDRHLQPLLAPADLIDMARLRRLDDAGLAALGRLPGPFLYRAGDRGFTSLSWEQALDLAATALGEAAPEARGLLVQPGGQTLETLFATAQAVPDLELGQVGQCRPAGHAEATSALALALGSAAATCSLADVAAADLVLIWGADPSVDQPVFMRTLAQAKRAGARVVVIDAGRPRGLEAAWTAASLRSAVFGSLIMDDLVQVQPGGDLALLAALLQALAHRGAVDGPFVRSRTTGWAELAAALVELDPAALDQQSGVSRARVAWVSELLARSRATVSVFGPGLLGAPSAGATVAALAHLHLARGMVGRPGSGILPLLEPGGQHVAEDLGLAGHVGTLVHSPPQVLWALGDQLAAGLDQPQALLEALGRVGTRIHQAGVLQQAHLVEPGTAILLLPPRTPYTQQGGAVVASVERRVRWTPEIPGLPVGKAQDGWWIADQLRLRRRPEQRRELAERDGRAVREALERALPRYRGLASLRTAGDHLQWGGPQLHARGFEGMPEGRARFDATALPAAERA